MSEKISSAVSGSDQNSHVRRFQGKVYLNPVDFRRRDIAFLKETKDSSSKGESARNILATILHSERTHFESAAPIACVRMS
jgi:hypothetical protein